MTRPLSNDYPYTKYLNNEQKTVYKNSTIGIVSALIAAPFPPGYFQLSLTMICSSAFKLNPPAEMKTTDKKSSINDSGLTYPSGHFVFG
ncbi:MAG: hypothetical protein JST09_07020 [Bacteroidetes bacterium]|nr:hypothetical protein [Bacteroidota bacterium]